MCVRLSVFRRAVSVLFFSIFSVVFHKNQKSREIALAPIFIKEEPIDIDSVTIKTEVDDDENFGSTNTNEFQFVDTNLKIEKEI